MKKTDYDHVFVDYKTGEIFINFTITLPSPDFFTNCKNYIDKRWYTKRDILKFNDANGKKFKTHLEASLYAFELQQEIIFGHLNKEYNFLKTQSQITSILK